MRVLIFSAPPHPLGFPSHITLRPTQSNIDHSTHFLSSSNSHCLPTMCWATTFKGSDPTSAAMPIKAASPTYKPPSITSRPPKEVRRMKTPNRLGEGEEGFTIEDALGDNKGRINAWSPPGEGRA